MKVNSSGMDIGVIGAGIIGLSCARELLKRGHRVTLFDSGEPGNESSTAAAGMLVPLFELGQDPAFLKLCREARDLWLPWAEELETEAEMDVDLYTGGAMCPISGSESKEYSERLCELASREGDSWKAVSQAELGELGLGFGEAVDSAVLFESEWRVDNTLVVQALERAFTKLGGELKVGCAALEVSRSGEGLVIRTTKRNHNCERVIVAAGAWSNQIELPRLEATGKVETFPVKGEMLSWSQQPWWRWRGSVIGPELYAVGRSNGDLLVGATVERVGFDKQTTVEASQELQTWAVKTFPLLDGTPFDQHWAGLRPGSPDGRPILGSLGDPAILLATGHYRNGILLAPWTARRIADLLEEERVLPECVDVARFS